MRILYLSPWFPYPLDTGFRIRVYHMLRVMARRHPVTLLTLDPQGWAPAQLEPVKALCERVEIIPRDPFHPPRWRRATRFLSSGPIVAAPIADLLERVRQLHSERPFDVAIASSVVMSAYALALPQVLRVLEEHNSNTRWMHERYAAQTSTLPRLRCWLSWRKSAAYEARLFPRFDLVTMVSDQDAATTRRLLPAGRPRVAVSPNGVDCEQFRPGLAVRQPERLIFSGALTYQANFEAMCYFLRDVYPLIRRAQPTVTLQITGSIGQADLSVLSLDESVTLTGFADDVKPLVAGAGVAIAPILSGGGTRLKILEAMALGTPVVATSKGAEGIDALDGEHLLLADSPAAFADSTLRLLTEPDLRQRLAANARRLVETCYDWSGIGASFLDGVQMAIDQRER